MAPDDFVAALGKARAAAIMRWGDRTVAGRAMDAAVRGGLRVVEFTLTTDGALELITEFARRDDVVVGAGTVLTVADARAAVDAGARFLVSPVVDEAVIAEAHALGVAVMPGAYTPTELVRAHHAGAQLQKLFPVAAAGPDTIRSILGPLPSLRIVPTNGVTLDNAADYLRAGAFAVGFVRTLFDPDDLRHSRYDAITARAAAMVARLHDA